MKREAAIKFKQEIEAFQQGKQIQIEIRNKWEDTDNPDFNVKSKYRVKPDEPKPTKRLPTIEEVEKWFMENRVFKSKDGALSRIMTVDTDELPIYIDGDYISIKRFCELYTHYDGSELYITKNEKTKLTYGGEIADFPIEVVERMLECQVVQGNKRDVKVFENKRISGLISGGFEWNITREGQTFWVAVIWHRQFDVFFQKYPKQ